MATISNTPRPGYVYDSTDGVWYPIGTGAHTHADYITSSSAINPTIVDAKGDLIAATAADTVARLAVGANDTVLTADSSTATGLKWAAPAGGGKVLQVVQASTTTETIVATTTYTDTTLTATITPSSATSKILVIVNQNILIERQATENGSSLQILRGATSVFDAGNAFYFRDLQTSTVGFYLGTIGALTYLDSPSTTSATTYKTQGKSMRTTSTAQVTYQVNSTPSTITLLEIGA